VTRPAFRRAAPAAALAVALAAAALPAAASPDDEPLSAQEPARRVATVARRALPVAKPAPAPEAPVADAPARPEPAASLFDRMHDKAADMIVSAMQFVGVRYARGGDSAEGGFDCSGFTRHVFRTALGLVLPRRADEQAQASGFARVERDALQPGDLVFFNTLRREFSHVGIYIGGNRFIHAPSRGKDVRTDDLRQAYWADRFNGARRPAVFSALGGDAAQAADGPGADRGSE
jgi:cell wall-associated NlpC family hydrolase